jgi:hypothetical protein
MKAIGMFLIVTGHVVGSPYHIFNEVSQPIYSKQLGVSFFVFIMGWGLANENRDGIRVLFNRAFPLYFFGLLGALILSVIFYISSGELNESNYLPLFLGVNVLFNNFPANPTTWYIGTYLHILLFWFFFTRGKPIGFKHLVIAFVVENLARCLILALDKEFMAYMLLPNWLTVFLLGSYLRHKKDTTWNGMTTVLVGSWLAILLAWSFAYVLFPFDNSFPFRNLPSTGYWVLPFRSVLITLVYLGNTYVVFEIVRRLPLLKPVSFFARNTIIIFIAHMPIIYQFSNDYYALFDSRPVANWTWILILFIGIGLVSEVIQKVINVKALSVWCWNVLVKLKFVQNS